MCLKLNHSDPSVHAHSVGADLTPSPPSDVSWQPLASAYTHKYSATPAGNTGTLHILKEQTFLSVFSSLNGHLNSLPAKTVITVFLTFYRQMCTRGATRNTQNTKSSFLHFWYVYLSRFGVKMAYFLQQSLHFFLHLHLFSDLFHESVGSQLLDKIWSFLNNDYGENTTEFVEDWDLWVK